MLKISSILKYKKACCLPSHLLCAISLAYILIVLCLCGERWKSPPAICLYCLSFTRKINLLSSSSHYAVVSPRSLSLSLYPIILGALLAAISGHRVYNTAEEVPDGKPLRGMDEEEWKS